MDAQAAARPGSTPRPLAFSSALIQPRRVLFLIDASSIDLSAPNGSRSPDAIYEAITNTLASLAGGHEVEPEWAFQIFNSKVRGGWRRTIAQSCCCASPRGPTACRTYRPYRTLT